MIMDRVDYICYKRNLINIQQFGLMTTITNFLNSNFTSILKQQQDTDHERPVWVVNSNRSKKASVLKQYQIDYCLKNQKNMVHLDFGISNLKLLRDSENKYQVEKGLWLIMPFQSKPYFLFIVTSSLRQNSGSCLNASLKSLSQIPELINSLKNPYKTITKSSNFSLLIENLQIMASDNKGSTYLQSFINGLSEIKNFYKQITIFKTGQILKPEHQFALQRISTCLTNIQQYDNANNIWIVRSTVRRYTGYSNEEKYTIKFLANNKIKVEKWVPSKQQEETFAQKQMINELGFVVKKGQKISEQNLKQMIYPHLRVIDNINCNCNKSQCSNTSCKQNSSVPEDLIILDDQQQDDDDIDV